MVARGARRQDGGGDAGAAGVPPAVSIPEHPQPKGRKVAAVFALPSELHVWADNPRVNDDAVPEVEASIREHGFGAPLLARAENGELIAGHTRVRAALNLGLTEVPVRYMTLDEVRAHALAIRDNRAGEFSRWDLPGLIKQLDVLDGASEHLHRIAGYDDDAVASLRRSLEEQTTPPPAPPGPTLADRFLVPPFTVLDARSGFWQDRKRQWLALGVIAPKIGSDGQAASQVTQPPDEVTARVVEIPPGSPLFLEIRAYLRERLKASGVKQKAVNEALGVVGMAGHYFGNAQPEVPTPEHWHALKPLLGLDDRYDAVMQSITRPPSEGTLVVAARSSKQYVLSEGAAAFKSQGRLHALQKTGSSQVDVDSNPKAERGQGSMIDQVLGKGGKKARAGAFAPDGAGSVGKRRPSPGGQPMPPHGPDRAASAGPRPNGGGSSAPAKAFGEKYEGGDAWRGAAQKHLTYKNDKVAALDHYRVQNGTRTETATSGTSIFDPVLCEIMLRWFAPRGGKVLDPFAGGTSLGVVAGTLGYAFTGVEVRADQVEANNATVGTRVAGARWVCGDSAVIDEAMPGGGPFDIVLTDPPYYSLERYSNDARDGSTKQTYAEFLAWYAGILRRAAGVLGPDRFFVVKIGEARDRQGHYCNIVGDTVRALTDAGLHFYNECILVTAVGSLPVRAGRAFAASRKLGKTHQQVLVFVKGDAKRAVDACGPVEVAEVPATLDLSESGDLLQ